MGSNCRTRDLSQDSLDLIGLAQLIRTFRNQLSLETIDFQWHNSIRFCGFFFFFSECVAFSCIAQHFLHKECKTNVCIDPKLNR